MPTTGTQEAIVISSAEDQMYFTGKADVMMAHANNDRLHLANRIARELNRYKVSSDVAVLPEFSRAAGQVYAIIEVW